MMTTFCPCLKSIYKFSVFLLLFDFSLPSSGHPLLRDQSTNRIHAYVTQQASQYPVYDVSPPSGIPGRAYSVDIISHDPNRKDITKQTVVFAPGAINVSDLTVIGKNGLSAKITIPDNTPLGPIQFVLKDKDGTEGSIIGIAAFEIRAINQGPVPPGLNPEVDVMWGVMARETVRQNFGKQIAKLYYGIQLEIGNDSGFDLQIAGVGFQLPQNTMIKNVVPSNSYRATRATLERQQELGARTFVLNSLKTAGILLTSFLPFWHAANAAANATLFADILSGPVVTGYERISPDTVLSQLTRLDDQALRDGLIIKNNSHIRTTVFIPKQLLDISKSEGRNDRVAARYLRDKKPNLNYRDDPQYVDLRLGKLVLIGQPIQYLNRVQVIETSKGGPVIPPPTASGTNPATVEQGTKKQLLIIPGSYLDDAVITPKDPDTNTRVQGIEFPERSVDSSGHILKTNVSVEDDVAPKKYTLVISTAGGSVETTLEVIQGKPAELSDITYVAGHPPATSDKQDVSVQIKITGKHLEDSQIVIPSESKGKLIAVADAKAKNGELVQTITVVKGTAAGSYKLLVKNKNPNPVELKFVVTEAKK